MKKTALILGLSVAIISSGVSAFTLNTENVKKMSKDELLSEYHELTPIFDKIDKDNKSAFSEKQIDLCKRFEKVNGTLSYKYMTTVDYNQGGDIYRKCNSIKAEMKRRRIEKNT